MKVEVRLFATLRQYLPKEGDGKKVAMELPPATRLSDLIARLGIPPQLAQLVMVNGVHETNRDRALEDGSSVSIFPPVAGGAFTVKKQRVRSRFSTRIL